MKTFLASTTKASKSSARRLYLPIRSLGGASGNDAQPGAQTRFASLAGRCAIKPRSAGLYRLRSRERQLRASATNRNGSVAALGGYPATVIDARVMPNDSTRPRRTIGAAPQNRPLNEFAQPKAGIDQGALDFCACRSARQRKPSLTDLPI